MARLPRAPMDAMTDLGQRNLFYDTWAKALGPKNGGGKTDTWLRAFGEQTKWLPAESWVWWLEMREPLDGLDATEVLGFLSLLIGLLTREGPADEAVRYAREMVECLGGSGDPEDSYPEPRV